MSPGSRTAAERRPVRRLLLDRAFGAYMGGKLVMSLGIWVQNIAAALFIYELTASAAMVGLVNVLQFVPQIVVSPWAGTLSDRLDRRVLLMVGLAVSSLSTAVLAAWLVLGGEQPVAHAVAVFAVLAATLVMGAGMAVVGPATHALIPGLVPVADLDTAVALNSSTGNIARAVGPALGAGMFAVVGPGWTFAASAAAYALFLAALAAMPYVDPPKGADSSLRNGLRFLRTQPAMVKLIVTGGVMGFGVDPILTLTPSIAAMFGRGELFVGVLASGFGCGAMLVLLVIGRPRFQLSRLVLAGLSLLATGLAGLALSPVPAGAVVAMVVAGAGFLLTSSSLMSLLQRQVPDEFRGRVMALWTVAYLGSRPVAAAFNGLVADYLSVRLALGLAAVLMATVAALTRPGAARADELRPPPCGGDPSHRRRPLR